MAQSGLSNAAIDKVAGFDCEESCITIIATHSTMAARDVLAILVAKKDEATLADIGYSSSRADGVLRPALNKHLRVPNENTPFPPKSFEDNTMKVKDVVIKTCV